MFREGSEDPGVVGSILTIVAVLLQVIRAFMQYLEKQKINESVHDQYRRVAAEAEALSHRLAADARRRGISLPDDPMGPSLPGGDQ